MLDVALAQLRRRHDDKTKTAPALSTREVGADQRTAPRVFRYPPSVVRLAMRVEKRPHRMSMRRVGRLEVRMQAQTS